MRLLPKRPVRVLGILAGVLFLLLLAFVIVHYGSQPTPKPERPSPVATVSPTAKSGTPSPSVPPLRSPQPIITPPPTASPTDGGPGKG